MSTCFALFSVSKDEPLSFGFFLRSLSNSLANRCESDKGFRGFFCLDLETAGVSTTSLSTSNIFQPWDSKIAFASFTVIS